MAQTEGQCLLPKYQRNSRERPDRSRL